MNGNTISYPATTASRYAVPIVPLTSSGNSGSFSLSAAPALKSQSKSRSSAARFPIFSQLSAFIIDKYWADLFNRISINNFPPTFSIKADKLDSLICRKGSGGKTWSIPLIYAGINQQTGLDGLNPEISQILQQIYIPPVEITTPGGALTSTLRTISMTTIRTHQIAIEAKTVPQRWLTMQITPEGSYYLAPEFLNTSVGLVLQHYITDIIQFLREHGNHHSAADLQRQAVDRSCIPVCDAAWKDLDTETQNEKYRIFIDSLATRFGYHGWDRDRFISHMRQYQHCNGIPVNYVIMQGGQIVDIYGLDFSQGWPPIRAGKSSASGSHTVNDLAVKHWRKYLKNFPAAAK